MAKRKRIHWIVIFSADVLADDDGNDGDDDDGNDGDEEGIS